jgi:hypothetical protein
MHRPRDMTRSWQSRDELQPISRLPKNPAQVDAVWRQRNEHKARTVCFATVL